MSLKPKQPRVGIYGRHSTAQQTATSSADQATACERIVESLGGAVVEVYLDPETSGYKRLRPGLTRLLADVGAGKIDVVVCEALDRLARDPEDVAWLGKIFSFHGVELHTGSEGHVDQVKFAVAGLLGSLFLTLLQDKTLRGMEAAVLAGRFAGGRAYGYKRVVRLDAKGEVIRGLLEIDEKEAAVVRTIFAWFAAGLSSIQIATRLNQDGVPGPRGGQWNASTIRGDPKKLVGILNNPLYVGRLVWGRRQWRRNPHTAERERRYRLRERSEWVEVGVPDFRIIDDVAWKAAETEMERRSRKPQEESPAGRNRAKHLLSGLIKCGCCGSNYTISGKDYYRCAGEKERGTCGNKVSVRKAPVETATLAVLQGHLLTEEHAKIFVEEFRREAARLAKGDEHRSHDARARMQQLEIELAKLAENLLGGLVSTTLMTMITEREAEKARLEAVVGGTSAGKSAPEIVPHPVLLERLKVKVEQLRASLDDDAVRAEAAAVLATLIESVTIYPAGERGPEAEVVCKVADLVAFARNDNAAPRSGVSSSMAVVAGTGFEPVTFRL